MPTHILRHLVSLTAGLALLIFVVPAHAQGFLGSSSGSSGSSSGGFSGGSGSSLGSSSSFGGSSSSSGGFLGSSGTSGSSGSTGIGSTGTTGTRSGVGGTTTSPGATTFLGPSFANPMALGYSGLSTFNASSANPSVIKTNQFGTAMFTITAANPTGASFGRTSAGGTATVTPAIPGAPTYASSIGIRRAPAYIAVPGFDMPAPSLSRISESVRNTVQNSPLLRSQGNVQVSMDGGVVILRGTVARMADRNLAEDMIRMTPGVNNVRNELVVKAPTP